MLVAVSLLQPQTNGPAGLLSISSVLKACWQQGIYMQGFCWQYRLFAVLDLGSCALLIIGLSFLELESKRYLARHVAACLHLLKYIHPLQQQCTYSISYL